MSKPVKTFKAGNIRASVFMNSKEDEYEFYTVNTTRSYQKNGKWEYTSSFRSVDVPTAARLMNLAFDWIVEQESAFDKKKQKRKKKQDVPRDDNNEEEVPF